MTTQDEVTLLRNKLDQLENESRKLVNAVQFSAKVRRILFLAVLLFALVSIVLFYKLYEEIRYTRVERIKQIIAENPEEFTEPMTKNLMAMVEKEGPYLQTVLKNQIESDSKKYLASFDKEQSQLVTNLSTRIEDRVLNFYARMLEDNEEMLRQKFPVLKDEEKLRFLRENMETVYEKIGQRYYVDYMKDELEDLTVKLEKFPPTKLENSSVPLSEQLATEFLTLVQMMLVNSDHYVIPDDSVTVNNPVKKSEADAPEEPEPAADSTPESNGEESPSEPMAEEGTASEESGESNTEPAESEGGDGDKSAEQKKEGDDSSDK